MGDWVGDIEGSVVAVRNNEEAVIGLFLTVVSVT